MKVVISVIGKFHSFDLARELHARGALQAIFSGYPRFKLRGEQLPDEKMRTFPYIQGSYMALAGRGMLGNRLLQHWEHVAATTFDAHVARHLPDCDVFVGLSGAALRSGKEAKRRGARVVCDRGSTHIRTQDELLCEEHDLWGLHFPGVDPRAMEREEAEYEQADCITVPSTFTRKSFLARGVPARKMRCIPYGVNLSRFHPTVPPVEEDFNVLFVGGMSLRKGVPYLLQSYARLQHPRKTLTFAGSVSLELIDLMKARGWWSSDVRVLGHVPQAALKDLMSRSHVLVLPSIEDGFGLVLAQAMACGCVVVASRNTGAEDLFTDGQEGLTVPIRDVEALTHALERLAHEPELRRQMSARALQRVARAGGWAAYGAAAIAAYSEE